MLTAYCDGACRVSNPGETSCGYVIYDGGLEVVSFSMYLGPKLFTNNYSEYIGLIQLLYRLELLRFKSVHIYCDSQLVVGQVNQEMAVNKEELKPLALLAYAMLVRGRHKLEHTKGHSGNIGNERADALANEALDRAGIKGEQ